MSTLKSQHKQIKILSIAGFGRSGSTILGNILGSTDGFFHTGETCFLWENGIQGNNNCGCGLPFKQCSTWSNIINIAYGDYHNIQEQYIRYLKQKNVPQNRDILTALLYAKNKKKLFTAHTKQYLKNQENLYKSIVEMTGCQVVVDSSKFPSYVYLLNLISTVELYVVHLVRDPRAVAYSWQKRIVRKDSEKSNLIQEQFKPTKVAIQWNAWNLLLELFGKQELKQRYIFVKYEDFIQHPQKTVEEIIKLTHLKNIVKPPFLNEQEVLLKTNHTIWGNPMRSKTGCIKLQADEEWKNKISALDCNKVTALTLPLLLKYKYL